MNLPFLHIHESLRPYKKNIATALFLIFLHTLVGCYLIFFSRNIQRDRFPLYIIFVFSFHQIFSIFDDWILTAISHAWTRDTRKNILQLYIQQGLPISGNSYLDWNEIQKEIYWLGESIFSFFRGSFRRILQIFIFSSFLIYLSAALFLFCFGFFLLLVFIGFAYGYIINNIRSRYIDSDTRLSVFEMEAAHARDIIKIHEKTAFMEKIHSSFLENFLSESVAFDRFRMLYHPLQVILFLITVAVIFYTGDQWVSEGTLSSKNFHSFLAGLSLLYTPLSGISNDVGAFLSLKKMKNLNFILKNSTKSIRMSNHPSNAPLSCISLKNVSFSYTSTPLFQNLNLNIDTPIFGFRGKNGSGKSTLLKILAGIYSPTTGKVSIEGKMIPFLELGVGFNPELSGRDNIFFNGIILGMRRKFLKDNFDKIVEFIEANNIPEDFSLRFAAKSGGCSGMVYKLGLDNNYYENDRKYEIEGVRIAIDAKSIFYMMGVTLDYVDDINGSGFVFNSPYNEKTCGCSH